MVAQAGEETVMSRSSFLIFVAVVSVIYGIGLVLASGPAMNLHGVAGGPDAELMARFAGASLLGIATMAWLARGAAESDGMTALLRGNFVIAAIGFVVALHATATGLMNTVGWLPVAIYALVGIGFGYYGFMRRA
jgi:ABC-type transport system involved in multi-copper enzyme maturation permease subunit